MTADEWERIKQIFDAALAEAPGNRAAYLQSNCGEDSAIRSEVERLLAEHERASGFLDRPSHGDPFLLSRSQITGAQAPLIGQDILHYQIVAKLCEGGMGMVYRAFDTQLLRPVALKVLTHNGLADPESNRRFLREARAASALNHPNITHVYEVGEADGTRFIVMEHIDGRTLGAAIREGELDFARVLDVCLQSADAIADAHEHGIIHRDIKPSNMMITPRGQLKILDFGLAKVNSKSADQEASFIDRSLTRPGLVMGTTRYMSPEQVLGYDVDQRTDMFSLGVVFYEMVTRHQAFAGRTSTETMDRILHSAPEPLASFRAKVPPELESIIWKCLEKDREKRYPSARELHAELLQWRELGPGPFRWRMHRRKFLLTAGVLGIAGLAAVASLEFLGPFQISAWADSIAVLPFVNMGSDPEAEYLSDGITDSIINSLSQLPRYASWRAARSLTTKARSSTRKKSGVS